MEEYANRHPELAARVRDLFPVLEYAAPEAFYIGANARMLARFDERTRWPMLAPACKRATLQALGHDNARAVFATYRSTNGELAHCLSQPGTDPDIPPIFTSHPPATTTADSSGGAPAALTTADQAAAALNAGDVEQVAKLAARALAAEPGDPEAGYLERVIERERRLGQAR
jgi:hypothetical protein